MKKPALALLAIAVVLTAALFVWFRLETPARGQHPAVSAAPAPSVTPEPASSALAQPATTPAPSAAAAQPAKEAPVLAASREEQRSAQDSSGGRVVRGLVAVPDGAPADDTLRVLALSEALAPRLVYGVGGVLDDLAGGKKSTKVLGSASVDAGGEFTLPLADASTVWLALDGRYLYSSSVVAVPAATGTVTLPAELGACLAGKVRLPDGVDAAKAFEKTKLELGPDSQNFTLTSNDPPLRRSAKLEAEGRYEVRAVRARAALELELDTEACADMTVKVAEFALGERRELDLTLLVGASVRGSVADEGGKPLPGAKVVAAESGFWGFAGEELAETTTDESGAFALEHIEPGKFLVIARHEGRLESEAQTLQLADREVREGLRLALGTGATISGRARFTDGAPAANAKIEVSFDPAAMVGMGAMNAARGASGKAECAEDGRFTVSGLGKGPFVVSGELTRGSGTEAEEWHGKVASVAPGTADVEVTLAAPCDLVGHVVDVAGAPVKAFRLRAHSAGAVFFDPGKTREEPFQGEAGEFHLHGLEAGKWEVTASAEGFGPPAPIEVLLPQTPGEPLVVTLALAASIAGKVLDPLGAPVPGAKVTLHVDQAQRIQRLRGDSKQPEALSDENGAFLLGGLGVGTISIEATREGYAASEAVDVVLRAGERGDEVVLHLRKGGTVTGEVYAADGKPASGVRVIAQSPGGLAMAMKQADSEGKFRIEHLEPGSWTITALLESATSEAKDGADADDTTAAFLGNMRFSMVQLDDGEEEHVVLGAPPKNPVVVRGTVRHGREPVTHGIVSFFAEGAKALSALKMSSLGPDGHFEARLDAPGAYVLTVQVTGSGSAFQQHTIEFRETIPEVEEHELDLELPLGGVSGRVRGPDKEPLASARVTLFTDGGIPLGSMMGGQYAESTTDENGRYTFLYLRPGHYGVAAGGAVFGGAFGNDSKAGRAVRTGLQVDEGRTLEGIDFDLDKPGKITGKVVDAAGAPIKDISVFVRDAGGRLLDRFSMIATAADGSFAYDGLAPGEYVLSARGKNLASAESAPVRLEEGGSASVQLGLYPGTKLVIEVVDGEGKAVEATVSVTDPNGHQVQGMVGWTEMSSLFADGLDTHKQTVGPLPPGAYTVTAVDSAGKKTSKPVTLDGQPERRLKLRVR